MIRPYSTGLDCGRDPWEDITYMQLPWLLRLAGRLGFFLFPVLSAATVNRTVLFWTGCSVARWSVVSEVIVIKPPLDVTGSQSSSSAL